MSGPDPRRSGHGGTTTFDARRYWEQRLVRHPGREGVGHAGIGEGLNGWMYRVRRRVFLRELAPLMPSLPARSVLDVGSGTGFYLDRWRELGAAPIIASDLTDVAVRRLRASHPDIDAVRFELGSEPPEQLRDRRFGAISAMEVVYHVLDDADYAHAFATLRELLEPGGVLVFSENFLHDEELRAPHQRSRTLGQIERVVRAAGLEILRRQPQFWLMNAPHDSPSRIRRLWWRGLAGVASRSNAAGACLGAFLYGPELVAVRRMREGPSSELMICRRPPETG
jgi:2-polyprenyl-3-methyl-5-hydroxy-6-metoxy-1,4-benzoquinol methylase